MSSNAMTNILIVMNEGITGRKVVKRECDKVWMEERAEQAK